MRLADHAFFNIIMELSQLAPLRLSVLSPYANKLDQHDTTGEKLERTQAHLMA
jgi:hypothetical protein